MGYAQRINPRTEYLLEERERVKSSPSLAERFNSLKSLEVLLAYFVPGATAPRSQIKYTVNLAFAKSVFCFACASAECVGGSFDLSAELARAIAEHRGAASGEVHCSGWQSKTTVGSIPCGHVLRYQLSLGY
jgi:hypothetical protein